MNRRYLTTILLAGALFWVGADREATASDGGGETISAEICADCHEDQVAASMRGPHAALDTEGLAAMAGAEFGCAACHGDPTEHLEEGVGEGTIFAFSGDELATESSARCLTCHGDTHPRFRSSPHFQAGMACVDCHSAHDPHPGSSALLAVDEAAVALLSSGMTTLDVGVSSAVCESCHSDVLADFEFNERHRLQEGVMDCASCHDPHGPATRTRLAGFKSEACVDCHADKGGPFVFEHGSVFVEGCTSCHTPHGGPNRHMLTFQNVGELCYSCHQLVPGFHTRFVAESNCTNCHSTIHGSNFDPFFLK